MHAAAIGVWVGGGWSVDVVGGRQEKNGGVRNMSPSSLHSRLQDIDADIIYVNGGFSTIRQFSLSAEFKVGAEKFVGFFLGGGRCLYLELTRSLLKLIKSWHL